MDRRKNKVAICINFILFITLIILWSNVFIIQGLTGAISWSLLKLVFAPIGLVLLAMFFVLLIIEILKRKNVLNRIISVILSIILAFPILMLTNIVPIKYPSNLKTSSPAVVIKSPFKEEVVVGWGGDKLKDNSPHAIWPSERWAYDLVMNPYDIGSDDLEDYGIYNKEIFSPVAGEIIEVYDKEKDIKPNTEEFEYMEGNHIYIRIDDTQTFLLLNHLKENSIKVKVGDHVKVGDLLGRVGNSGSTSEPHLHIHHQKQDPTKTIYPVFAEGLPLYFYNENNKLIMPTRGSSIKK